MAWSVSTSFYLAPRVQNIGVLVDYRDGSLNVPLVTIHMKITKQQITDALGIDSDDLSKEELAIALREIELILDSVAEDIEDDFKNATLGDASNLIQMIRNGL